METKKINRITQIIETILTEESNPELIKRLDNLLRKHYKLEKRPVGSEPFNWIIGEQKSDVIDWNDFSQKISKYFSVGEVVQYDRSRIPQEESIKINAIKLAKKLDNPREDYGKPILVNSWYRPPDVNRKVGGVSNSQHLNGGAADIYPSDGNITGLYNILNKYDFALGLYNTHIHVDLRGKGIRWSLRS
ncbi:UNVERIFIED_CONTAM: hypothetical protein BEN50_04850 [Euhalothece sp. KZN 001]